MKRGKHFFQSVILMCVCLAMPLSLHAGISTNWFYYDNEGNPSSWGAAGCAYGLSFNDNQDGDNTVTVYAYTTGSDSKATNAINLVIPEKVVDNSTTYTVTRIDNGTTGDDGVFKSNQSIVSTLIPNTVTTIGNGTFWSCSNLATITLGNHISYIGDDAFQYCSSLQSISLPNTLKDVGDHFLCHCIKLTTLVIPESLIKIGSYFLHGCEGLRTVYLLGTAKKELGDYPFCSQSQQGDAQVHDCTFWVESKEVYQSNYKDEGNWKYVDIDNNEAYDSQCDGTYQNGRNGLGKNKYQWNTKDTPTPPEFIEYKAKWISACFPTDVDVKANFGDNAKIAVLTAAKYIGIKEGEYAYQLTFTTVQPDEDGNLVMKAGHPYLLSADPENEGSGFIVKQATTGTNPTSTIVNIDNDSDDPSSKQTSIKMIGSFSNRKMQKGEFFFSNPDPNDKKSYNKDMGFYQINEVTCTLPAYRCYWQIIKDGKVCQKAKINVSLDYNHENTTTSITTFHHKINTHNIHNLQGQRYTLPLGQLPKGLYIIDGKKRIINK